MKKRKKDIQLKVNLTFDEMLKKTFEAPFNRKKKKSACRQFSKGN